MNREQLYDELSSLITDYEGNGSKISVGKEDFYNTLVKIQNYWENTITAEKSTHNNE